MPRQFIKLCFLSTLLWHSTGYGAVGLLDLSVNAGLPDGAGFELAIPRLRPLRFGFGLGTIPIQQLVKNYLKFDANDYRQEISGYALTPSVGLSWTTFSGFVEYLAGENFYARLSYVTWNIATRLDLAVSGGMLGDKSVHLGSLAFSLTQPMLGLSGGWRYTLLGDYFFDFSLGILRFLAPHTSVQVSTIVDAYNSLLPPEEQEKITEARGLIDDKMREFSNTYRNTVHYAPILLIGFGRHI